MFHNLLKSIKTPFLYFAPSYAVLVYVYPETVWWTWLTFIGLIGVYGCLLALWVSMMALDEIQINLELFRAKRQKKSKTCSGTKCNLNS